MWVHLLLLVIFGLRQTVADNPTSIIKPYDGPDPGYIIAESTSGLSNRLRVLAAYMYIGEYKYDGAHTVFIWDKTSACPGHFLSIFEPIPNVVFATNSSRYVLDKHAKIVYENSFAVFGWIMQMNNIPKNRHGLPSWQQIEYNMYSKYYPTREVMLKAIKFVDKYNICNSSAMHMRTTDLDKQMGERKRTNFQSYFKFVESRPAEEKVFLLTDDPKTQRIFTKKYGSDKIIVYSEIAEAHEQPPLFVTAGLHRGRHHVSNSVSSHHNGTQAPSSGTSNGGGGGTAGIGGIGSVISSNSGSASVSAPVLEEDHRFTTLEHTLIDVIIAAHAREFKPSGFSSLSDLVKTFENIGKKDRGWCAHAK